MLSRLSTIGNLLGFMVAGNRKFWLLPLVLSLTIVMLLIVLGGASAIGAFLYPLF